MQIGKYSLEQLLKVSVFDKEKIKFAFWGIFKASVVYFIFQGIAITFANNGLVQTIILALGDLLATLFILGTLIGVTFAVKDSLGGKKKALPMKKQILNSISKLPAFVGVVVLYLLALLAIVVLEAGIYMLGYVPVWGSLILALGTIPLVIFNTLLLIVVAFGVKLLPAVIASEKGKVWGLFVKLNKLILAKPVELVTYFALLLLTMAPLAAITAGLFGAGSYIATFIQKIAFQKILLAGGMVEWPSVVFGLVTGLSYMAVTVFAVSFAFTYFTAALYSIYLAVKTK